MIKKTNNIARNLPKVGNTGNQLLNLWLGAAEEIIKDIRQRLASLETKQTTNNTSGGSGQTIVKLPNLNDYERIENKVSAINDQIDGNKYYPSVTALKDYVSRVLFEEKYQNVMEAWEIELETFEELDVKEGDYLKIVGNGSFGTLELRENDIVFVYLEEGIGLQLLVVVDSRNIMKGVHTTDDLDEGINHLYFTQLRTLETVLENLTESIDEIEATDSILVALGKAKGRINHLQTVISSLELNLQQQIDNINVDLDGIHASLETINTSIDSINASISTLTTNTNASISALNADIDSLNEDVEGLRLDMNDRLKTSDLLSALQATVPSPTGTYILTATDGVLSWVEQP